MSRAELRLWLAAFDPAQIRRDAGLTLAAVAQGCGTQPRSVWRWETRKRLPRCDAGRRYVRVLEGLCRHQGVNVDWEAAHPLPGRAG